MGGCRLLWGQHKSISYIYPPENLIGDEWPIPRRHQSPWKSVLIYTHPFTGLGAPLIPPPAASQFSPRGRLSTLPGPVCFPKTEVFAPVFSQGCVVIFCGLTLNQTSTSLQKKFEMVIYLLLNPFLKTSDMTLQRSLTGCYTLFRDFSWRTTDLLPREPPAEGHDVTFFLCPITMES